jgi:pilus assembly protein Flp/PilA
MRTAMLGNMLLRKGAAMPAVKKLLTRFARETSAATAIEYSLIAAGIALAIVAVVTNIGSQLNTPFVTIQAALK